jgi:three-Cys-motif partner protein
MRRWSSSGRVADRIDGEHQWWCGERFVVATGANDKYWKDARLPGVLKHNLLKRYPAVFLIRTSSIAGRAVYFDGFAGRGIYENGKLGSAGQMLEFAVGRQYGPGATPISLYLCEKDKDSFAALDELCDKYRAKQIDVHTRRDDAKNFLGESLPQFATAPAFLFLDPCGVGIPFEDIVAALNRGGNRHWPPTEALINFSLEAVRRIGGHVTSGTPNEKTMQTLDVSLGDDWWRAYFANGVTDQAVNDVVHEFIERLAKATKTAVITVPVHRAPTHKPIYHLIFATRHPAGVWHFAHDTAKAVEDWWTHVREGQEQQAGPGLFELNPRIEDVESEAVPVVAENIRKLVAERGEVRLGDYPVRVFGQYLGRVREGVARKAVKALHKAGETPSTGVGGKVENLRVAPNQTAI